jgi:hypothetical protein
MEFKLPDPLDSDTIAFCDELAENAANASPNATDSLANSIEARRSLTDDDAAHSDWSHLTSPKQRTPARMPLEERSSSGEWTSSREIERLHRELDRELARTSRKVSL